MALWLLWSTVVVSLRCLSQLSSAEREIYRKNLALGCEVTAPSSPHARHSLLTARRKRTSDGTHPPALPRAWHDANAAVMWMDRIYEISISNGTTSVSRRR